MKHAFGIAFLALAGTCLAAAFASPAPAPLPVPWNLYDQASGGSDTITMADPTGTVRAIKVSMQSRLDEWETKFENTWTYAGGDLYTSWDYAAHGRFPYPGEIGNPGDAYFAADCSINGVNLCDADHTADVTKTTLAAYDGTTDYGGPSGVIVTEFDDWSSGTVYTITNASVLSYINGGGRDLDVTWNGVSARTTTCVFWSEMTDITDVDMIGGYEFIY